MTRCQALDQHAKRCGKAARWSIDYHGGLHYGWLYENTRPTWVRVYLCDTHTDADGSRRPLRTPTPGGTER